MLVIVALIAAPAGAVDFADAWGDVYVQAVATDGLGQSFIAGDFSVAAVNIGGVTLTRVGTDAIFVAKLDETGTVVWAKSFGGDFAYAKAVAVDGSGNVYVAGEQLGSMITPPLPGVGNQDAFVLKLDSEGNVLWARNFGGLDATAVALGVVVDVSSNVYVGGYQSGNLSQPLLGGIGYFDAFAVKLDASGNQVWAKNFGAPTTSTYAQGIAVDALGNVYLSGSFESGDLPAFSLTRIGNIDALAVKLDANGTPVWGKNFGGVGATTIGIGIAVDASGDVYLGGDFSGADLTTPGFTRHATGTSRDAFALRLDGPSGATVWAKNFGGLNADTYAAGIAVDGPGNVYLGGGFCCGGLADPLLNQIGYSDALAIRLDPSGNTIWTRNFGGSTANAYAAAIAVDSLGTVFLSGSFSGGNLQSPPLLLVGSQSGLLVSQLSSGPPSATTGAAAEITANTVTLRGTVSSNGASTVVTFEFGPDTNYGRSMAATQSPLGATMTGAAVSAGVTGLACATQYHYRVKATSVNGTATGSDATFTTASCQAGAPTATTGTATSLTQTGATLAGTVSSNGSSTNVWFDYGQTATYGNSAWAQQSPVTGSGVAVSAAITGLACGRSFHFRVVASNTAGTAYGSDQTFSTAACPTGFNKSTPASGGTVVGTATTLSWGPSAGVTSYEYCYDTTNDNACTSWVPNSVNTSANVSGLVPGTTYYWQVRANSAGGTAYADGSANAFWSFATIAVPTATTNAASAVTVSGATLAGTVSSNGASTSVTFAYGTTTGYGSTATASPSPVTGTGVAVTAPISGLACGTVYHYRVVATNSAGTTNGSDMTFITSACVVPPPTVTTTPASAVSTTSATLNGVASSNGSATNVSFQYGLTASYGSTVTASPSPLAANASNAVVSAAVTGLACNTLYHYRVTATSGGGTTNGSDATFTTGACAAPPPTVTTNPVSAVLPTSAKLNAVASSNGSVTSVSFQYGLTAAYGTTLAATPNSLAANASGAAVSAAVSSLTCNTQYHYRVVATNSGGTTNGSDVTFTTGACSGSPPSVTTNAASIVLPTSATLNALASSNGNVTTVSFQYGSTTAYGNTVAAAQSPLPPGATNTPLTASVSGLTCNTLYHFRSVATNVNGTTYGADLRLQTAACGNALTVKPLGTGVGQVTSSPAGINCGSACSEALPVGAAVTLTAASPFYESVFSGWGGACPGSQSPTCNLTVMGDVQATATFTYIGSPSAYDSVQDAYLSYYGRPADPAGRAYWAGMTDQSGQGLGPIINAFGYSDEFNRRYGGLSNEQLVTLIYQQTLSRDPDQAGLNWYVAELNAGRMTLQTITLNVLYGATSPPDSTVVANKRLVANYYSSKVAAGCAYGPEQDGLDVLSLVDASPASITEAKALVDNWCGQF